MAKQQENERSSVAPSTHQYSIPELEEFGRLLEQFRYDYKMENGEVVHPINIKESGSTMGAYKKIVKEFSATEWKTEPYTVTEYHVIVGSKYDEFQNKPHT